MSDSFSFQAFGEGVVASKTIKNNLNSWSSQKHTGNSITQNFFATDFDNDDYFPSSQSQILATSSAHHEQNSRPVKKSRRKLERTMLQPLKQKQKVEIYSNSSALLNNIQDIDEIVVSLQTKPQEQQKLITNEKVGRSRRKSSRKQERQIEKEEIIEKKETQNKNINQHLLLSLDASSQLLFDDKDDPFAQQVKWTKELPKLQHQNNKQQKVKATQQYIQFAFLKRNVDHDFHEDQQQQTDKNTTPNSDKGQSGSEHNANVQIGQQFFHFQNQQELRRQLFVPIPEKVAMRMQIIRDSGGLNTFWPEFHMRFYSDKRRVISAKKTSSRPTSTFLISRNSHIFTEGNHEYLGKVKSTSLGDSYNIFGPGLNPSDSKDKGLMPRELVATIAYSTSLFTNKDPRKFCVYIIKPGYHYYKDFPQVRIYGEEVPLNVLYGHHENKQKIHVLRNRKPLWSEEAEAYVLNFRGMAACASVKNFILEDQSDEREVILFGKQDSTTFNLNISPGISPYVAFAVAIASFDNRLIFQ